MLQLYLALFVAHIVSVHVTGSKGHQPNIVSFTGMCMYIHIATMFVMFSICLHIIVQEYMINELYNAISQV